MSVIVDGGNYLIEAEGPEEMDASDGYHTFTELYDHRIILYIAFCKMYASRVQKSVWNTADGRTDNVWRSKLHSDGSKFDGWYILGIGKEKGSQITYHLPEATWDQTSFAETLDKAPEFDGHTSADVLERIKNLESKGTPERVPVLLVGIEPRLFPLQLLQKRGRHYDRCCCESDEGRVVAALFRRPELDLRRSFQLRLHSISFRLFLRQDDARSNATRCAGRNASAASGRRTCRWAICGCRSACTRR